MKIALAAVLAAVIIAGGLLVALSGHTAIQAIPAVTSIGVSTPVTVRLANPHGVREVRGYVAQGGTEYPVFESKNAATRLLWRRHEAHGMVGVLGSAYLRGQRAPHQRLGLRGRKRLRAGSGGLPAGQNDPWQQADELEGSAHCN